MGPRKPAARHTVAVPLEADQAGWRHPLALLDKAVEGRWCRHQGSPFRGPDLRDRARQRAVPHARPLLDAALLQPGVHRRQIREIPHQQKDLVAGILHVLLDLSFLPARRRVAELGLEDVVAGHRQEPRVDLPGLASADPVHRGLHIVVYPPPGDTAEHPKRVPVRVEQHLVRLQQIRPQQERPAVRQLDMGDLELRVLPGDRRPVLAPVELEGLPTLKDQRYEGAAAGALLLPLAIGVPFPRERRDPVAGALVAQGDQVRMELLQRSPLLAGLARFRLQPRRSLGPACSVDPANGTPAPPFPPADTCGSCCATAPSAARSPGWIADPATPSVGSHSVKPCRSLRCPRFQSQGTFMGHFSAEISRSLECAPAVGQIG